MHDLLANVLPDGHGPKPLGPQPVLNVRDDAKGRVIVDSLTEVSTLLPLHESERPQTLMIIWGDGIVWCLRMCFSSQVADVLKVHVHRSSDI